MASKACQSCCHLRRYLIPQVRAACWNNILDILNQEDENDSKGENDNDESRRNVRMGKLSSARISHPPNLAMRRCCLAQLVSLLTNMLWKHHFMSCLVFPSLFQRNRSLNTSEMLTRALAYQTRKEQKQRVNRAKSESRDLLGDYLFSTCSCIDKT